LASRRGRAGARVV